MKNIIYNENCKETFTKIEDKYIDGIITSPPYNINIKRSDCYYKNGYSELDGLSENDYLEVRTNEFREFSRIIKDDGVICYNISYSCENPILPTLLVAKIHKELDLTVADIICWKKSNAMPFQTSPTKLSRVTELIYIFVKKDRLHTFKTNKKVSKINKKGQKFYRKYVNYIEANNISAQQNINTNSFTSCGDTTVSQTASAFVFDAGTYKVRIDARVTSLCSTPTWMQIFLYQDTLPLQVLQHGSSFAATGTNQIGNLFIDGYFYLCRTSQITLRATTYGRFNLGLPTQTMYAAASSNASLSADLLASLQLSSCNMSMFVQKVSDAATPATNKLAITL